MNIGSFVTNIKDCAFFNCSLTSVTIPNSVKSIGGQAFSSTNLKEVVIYDLAAWCQITFSEDSSNPLGQAGHLFLEGKEVTDLIIPDNVTSIGDFAFYGCTGLTSVTIPNSVTSIGKNVFEKCSNLTSVTIPNSVESIGYYAFHNCTSLTSIEIPSSVTSINSYAFSGCSALSSFTVAEDNPNYRSVDGVLYDKELTTIVLYPKGKK